MCSQETYKQVTTVQQKEIKTHKIYLVEKKGWRRSKKNIKKRAIAFDFYFMFLFTIGTNRNI